MKKGEVWIKYDEDSKKYRPFMVVGHRLGVIDDDILMVKLSAQQPKNKFDIPLKFWLEYGLNQESIVRCSKLYTVKEKDLKFKVAQILGNELIKIKETIASYIMED